MARAHRTRRRGRLLLETLERRDLLAVTPLSLADSVLFGASANANQSYSFLVHEMTLSGDGRVVAFQNDYSSNLVPGDYFATSYTRNLETGVTTPLNLRPDGARGNDRATIPLISEDGRFVIFLSGATDLTAGTYPGSPRGQVFRRDLQAGTTELVSKTPLGNAADGHSEPLAVGATGRLVAFKSTASDLVAADPSNDTDLFVRDLQAGTTRRIALNTQFTAVRALFSGDERYLFFETAGALTQSDANQATDIYRVDVQSGDVVLVSANPDGVSGNGPSLEHNISADGRYVVFRSHATDLRSTQAPDAGATAGQVFRRDLQTGTSVLVSARPDGAPGRDLSVFNGGGGSHSAPIVSADGRFVTWTSFATNLVAGVTVPSGTQVYRRDLESGTTVLVSAAADGAAATSATQSSRVTLLGMTSDGRHVAFAADATNLAAAATNGQTQVYLRDMQAPAPRLVTRSGSGAGNGLSGEYGRPRATGQHLSPDGSRLVFGSEASDLVAGDNNRAEDIFAYEVADDRLDLATARHPSLPPEFTTAAGARLVQASPDGRFVLLSTSYATGDVVAGSFGSLFLRDRTAGTVTLVAAQAFDPHMTPDGRFVVYSPGSHDRVELFDVQAGTTVSLDQGTAQVLDPRLSPDGRFVAFNERLAPGRLWVHDRQQGSYVQVNVTPAGAASAGSVVETSYTFSPDSRFLAFVSDATDLVTATTGGQRQLYLRDLLNATTELVSSTPAGAGGNGSVEGDVSFSDDGRRLAFSSRASDLAATPASGSIPNVYVRDLASGQTRLGSPGGGGIQPRLSADGRYLAFLSESDFGLFTPDSPFSNRGNVFWHDLDTGTLRLVSANAAGSGAGNGRSFDGYFSGTPPTRIALSPDGQTVAFINSSTNLVAGYTPPAGLTEPTNVYARDIVAGVTTLVSTAAGLVGSNFSEGDLSGFDTVSSLSLSVNGIVTFDSRASSLFAGDTNATWDVFAGRVAPATAAIRGSIFVDDNNNGARDTGEGPLAGVRVYADLNNDGSPADSEPSMVTGTDGNYALAGLIAGTYTVRAVLPAGFTQTLPAAGAARTATLASDTSEVTAQDFGAFRPPVDLAVQSVAVPLAVETGEPITVTWQVRNLGSAADGAWQDAIYLSRDDVLDASDILVANVAAPGPLAPQATYQGSATVNVPAATTGTYRVLVQADRRHQFNADPNRVNNVAASSATTLSVPLLAAGASLQRTFTDVARARYFRVDLAVGQVLRLGLDGADGSAAELYVRRDELPTRGLFDKRSEAFGQPDQSIVVPSFTAGTYYVLAYGAVVPGGSAPFTITAAVQSYEISRIDQTSGDRGGSITIGIHGARFVADMAIELENAAGASVTATRVQYVDPSLVYATFDLTAVPEGTYDVVVTTTTYEIVVSFPDQATADVVMAALGAPAELMPNVDPGAPPVAIVPRTVATVLPGGFTVLPAALDSVTYGIASTDLVRAGRTAYVTATVTNHGTHDVAAPLLNIVASANVPMSTLRDGAPWQYGSMAALATGSDGPADVIRPGRTGQIQFQVAVPAEGLQALDFDLHATEDDGRLVDFTQLVSSLGEDPASARGMAALAALQAQYGTNWTASLAGLRAEARRLAEAGTPKNTVPELMAATAYGGINQLNLQTALQQALITVPPPGSAASHTANDTVSPPGFHFTRDEDALRYLEITFSAMGLTWLGLGAPTAAEHMRLWMGPSGANTGYAPGPVDYPSGSDVSREAENFDLADSGYKSVKKEAQPHLEAELIFAARTEDDSRLASYTRRVLPLWFYTAGFAVGPGINLKLGFGRTGFGSVRFVDWDLPRRSECDTTRPKYSATVEYTWTDEWGFEQADVGAPNPKRELNRFGNAIAYYFEAFGWASRIPLSLSIESRIEGDVELAPRNPDDEKCRKKPPEPKDGDRLRRTRTNVVRSRDPNDITGPAGHGSAGWITPDILLPYTIRFENDPQLASAPAQEVVIAHTLDADLDPATFELGQVRFGDQVVDVPAGLQSFQRRVQYRNQDTSPLLVDVSAALDVQTRVVTWTFRSVDPATGALPDGALDGFLPVNDATGRGEGSVQFSIRPRAGLPTGTAFTQQASIIFDTNAPLETNVHTNTIDIDAPTGAVTALPAVQSTASFAVSWQGADTGAGVTTYDVYVSENGAAFTPLLLGTAQTTTTFNGVDGRTYAFRAVAVDGVGNRETAVLVAEAQTTVRLPPPPPAPPTVTPQQPTPPSPPSPSPALVVKVPRQVKAAGLVVSLRGRRITIVAQNPSALIRLRVTTTLGTLRLRGRGVRVLLMRPRTLTLLGNAAALNRAVANLSLLLTRARSRARLTLTASVGRSSSTASFLLVN